MHKLSIYQNCKPNLSVRDTEALVKNYQESLKQPVSPKSSNFEIEENDKNNTYFGNKVDVKVAVMGKEKLQFHLNQLKILNVF
jgi:ParB family chromosome partitioning protein